MMEKYSEIGPDENGSIFHLLKPGTKLAGLEKQADLYDQPVRDYLDSLKPSERFVYALINAMGAGEAVGSNRNGDYFPEEALKEYHPTFVQNAKVYQHHVNKDPRKKLGDVLFSHYNPVMRRVELVVALDREIEPARKIINQLIEGHTVRASMGCRIPEDFCSITGKAQKTRADYSDYCKYQMGTILPDGRKVYAINKRPNFFDISIVTIPADRTSYVMGYYSDGTEKNSQMTKRISGEMDYVSDPNEVITRSQRPMTDGEVQAIGDVKLNKALSTLLALRIIPHPDEFSRVVTASYGESRVVNFIPDFKNAIIPDDVGPEFVDRELAQKLAGSLDDLSLTKDRIVNRVVKTGSLLYPKPADEPQRAWWRQALFNQTPEPQKDHTKNPVPAMVGLGALYAGYLKLFGSTASTTGFAAFLTKSPWLAPVIAGGVGAASLAAQYSIPAEPVEPIKEASVGQHVNRLAGGLLVATPTSYFLGARAEAKARRGERISGTEDFFRKYPLLAGVLGGVAGTAAVGKVIGKPLSKLPNLYKVSEYNPKLDEIFFEILS